MPVRRVPGAPVPLAPVLVAATCLLVAAALATGLLTRFLHTPSAAPGSPPRASVLALLDTVRVVDLRVPHPGYERACPGGCSFGIAWTDLTDAPAGRNGCDTRNDVLRAWLRDARLVPGSTCTVESGVLVDPYTGTELAFHRARPRYIQIDHVYPLAAAWDLGAHSWDGTRREFFANDATTNLVPTSGHVNQRKSDSTPADWLPPEPRLRCAYAARYLAVAVGYTLPVTRADHAALTRAAHTCPAD